jgi:hypothetical protein
MFDSIFILSSSESIPRRLTSPSIIGDERTSMKRLWSVTKAHTGLSLSCMSYVGVGVEFAD